MLLIKKANHTITVLKLDDAIGRAKASMTKEAVAWVEQQVNAIP